MPARAHAVAKRAANVSVRIDLLVEARAVGINISALLERALVQELASLKRKQWREENRDAIAAYNDYVDGHGTFSDDVRSF